MRLARASAARPRRIADRSQRRRSCCSSSTGSPSSPIRAGNRAAVSSRRASSPCASGSSGTSRATMRASRTASRARSGRIHSAPEPGRRPLGEDEVDHAEHRAQAFAALLGRRHHERHPCGRERLLGARDPGLHGGGRHQERRAISSLVSPARTRSVSATRASRERTGWQATNISASTSSSIRSGSQRTSSVPAPPGSVDGPGTPRRRPGPGRGRRTARRGPRAGGRRRWRAGAPP